MIARIQGYAARFCSKICAAGFKADREGGMNYGLHRINGVVCLHREEWSMASCQCAYCGEKVNGNVPAHLRYKFQIPDPLTQSVRDTLDSCTK